MTGESVTIYLAKTDAETLLEAAPDDEYYDETHTDKELVRFHRAALALKKELQRVLNG